MNKGVQWPLAIVERVGCTYSMFLQIERIWYAAEFVHPTRVGFVNSIARICRQIQRSGGGARPPRQRAGHRRQTAVAAVCATERRRRQARQRHLGSSDPVPQTNGAARGRPSPATRALSLFRPRWSDRSARDGRLFAARERDIASKVAAGARSTAIVIARFPPAVHAKIHWPGRHDLPAKRSSPSLRTLRDK